MDDLLNQFNRLDLAQDHELELFHTEFVQLGSQLMNRPGTNTETAQFRSRFVSKFGFSPLVIARLWQILVEEQSPLPKKMKKLYVLWAMMLMKEYPTQRNFSSNVGGVDERTASNWAFKVLEEINCLVAAVVSFECYQCFI